MNVSEPRAARGWLVVAIGLIALVMMLGVSATPTVEAQAIPSPTRDYTWKIADSTQPLNRLLVDPFGRRFRVEGVNVTPIATIAPDMRVSRQRVSWRWVDRTADVHISASIDRVRHLVRATYWRRPTRSGSTPARGTPVVVQINARPQATVLSLPRPPEPFVTIEDFRFVPRSKIIKDVDSLSIQNDSQLSHDLVFDRSAALNPATCTRRDDPRTCRGYSTIIGVIEAGRSSRLYPTPPPATPRNNLTPTPAPVVIWDSGTYTYYCRVHPFMVGSIVVQSG